MEYLFIILILILVSIYVCYPFFSGEKQSNIYIDEKDAEPGNIEDTPSKLEAQKLEVYSAIKEIEFDYGLGKLSDEDYNELRNDYLYRAAQIVKKLEQDEPVLHSSSNISIEDEIRAARSSHKINEDEIEREIYRLRGKKN